MFLFISFLIHWKETETETEISHSNVAKNAQGKPICKGFHRYYDKNLRICKCDKNYVTDEEDYDKGCWKCEEECKGHLVCRYGGKEGVGKCKCESGYAMINSTKCLRIKPKIVDFIPPLGEEGSIVNFTVKDYDNFDFNEAFCRFNSSTITKAYRIDGNVIQCKIPNFSNATDSETITLAVSYDGELWTDEPILFAIEHRFHFHPAVLVILLLLSASIPIFTYIFIKDTKNNKEILDIVKPEEKISFLKKIPM